MPEKKTPKKKMPKWAIPVGIIGVIAIWYFFIRGKSSGPAQGGQPFPSSTPVQDGANAGQPSVNSAPADSLAPGILDALGLSLQQTGLLGGSLGEVAIGAQNQLGSIAGQAVSSSFSFGESALASQANVLATAMPYSGGGGSPSPVTSTTKATVKPFGGIVSTRVNPKTHIKTTTYASGRIVQQAPGKTAYVAHK